MDLLGTVMWFFISTGAYARIRSPAKFAKILGLDIAERVTRKAQDTGWGCKGPLQEKRCICSWYKEIIKSDHYGVAL